jgi:hypothetical protein
MNRSTWRLADLTAGPQFWGYVFGQEAGIGELYQVAVVWLQSFVTVADVSPERSQAVPFAVEEMRLDRDNRLSLPFERNLVLVSFSPWVAHPLIHYLYISNSYLRDSSMEVTFVEVDRETPYLLPPSIQDWLPEKHLARFAVEIVE